MRHTPMNDDLTLILMAGGEGETPIERAMLDAYRAAARDTIERALEAGVASHIVVATHWAEWVETLSDLPVQVDLDTRPPTPFHFGNRLAGVIQRHHIRRAFYLGGGSAPLMDGPALRAVADAIRHEDGLIVTNNIHSSDWAAFAPAQVAVRLADELRSDNSLGWILSRLGGLAAREWPRSAASQFDLDTPTDLVIAGLHARPDDSGQANHHRRACVAVHDRFYSDLRRPDDIADPFLRDFTASRARRADTGCPGWTLVSVGRPVGISHWSVFAN
jgi:hypothetical protein